MPIITCDKCGVSITIEAERRPLDDGCFDVGFACQGCKAWYHSWYENDSLVTMRDELEAARDKIRKQKTSKNIQRLKKLHDIIERKQKRFTRLFDDLQERVSQNETISK